MGAGGGREDSTNSNGQPRTSTKKQQQQTSSVRCSVGITLLSLSRIRGLGGGESLPQDVRGFVRHGCWLLVGRSALRVSDSNKPGKATAVVARSFGMLGSKRPENIRHSGMSGAFSQTGTPWISTCSCPVDSKFFVDSLAVPRRAARCRLAGWWWDGVVRFPL